MIPPRNKSPAQRPLSLSLWLVDHAVPLWASPEQSCLSCRSIHSFLRIGLRNWPLRCFTADKVHNQSEHTSQLHGCDCSLRIYCTLMHPELRLAGHWMIEQRDWQRTSLLNTKNLLAVTVYLPRAASLFTFRIFVAFRTVEITSAPCLFQPRTWSSMAPKHCLDFQGASPQVLLKWIPL